MLSHLVENSGLHPREGGIPRASNHIFLLNAVTYSVLHTCRFPVSYGMYCISSVRKMSHTGDRSLKDESVKEWVDAYMDLPLSKKPK